MQASNSVSPPTPFADVVPARPVRRALVQIYLTDPERDLVRERAFRERTSVSSWVRAAIAAHMSTVEPERSEQAEQAAA